MSKPLSTLVPLGLALLLPLQDSGPQDAAQAELERIAAEISREIEVLRGETFESPVAVSVTDSAGFHAYAQRRLEATSSPEELAFEETMSKLLGLIPPDMDYLQTMLDLLEEQVGGFYDPDGDRFYLMDSYLGDVGRIIIAHELTHALDDQLYDIDAGLAARRTNHDALYAFQSVVEGSGTAVMNKWTIQHMSELEPSALAEAGSLGSEALEAAPPWLWRPLLGAYLRGASFLVRSDSTMKGQMSFPEAADFERAFQDPPRSSEQVLHPEKYWDAEQRDEPVDVDFDVPELPAGWEVLGENTLGELGLACVTEPPAKRKGMTTNPLALMSIAYTNDAATGWGGDRVLVLGHDARRLLVLDTVWDDADEAREFAAALAGLTEHLESNAAKLAAAAEVESSGVRVLAAEDGASVRVVVRVGVAAYEARDLIALLDGAAAGD
jgi:hypothetical protein